MSDDFDKEAERQRLREKYERDKEDRESTERMSELLLQGATMTNRHCDTCGSPIFRYQGQEFCPNCQMDAEGTAQAQDGDGAGAESVGTDGTAAPAEAANAATTAETANSPPSADRQPGAQAGANAQSGPANAQSGPANATGSIPEHGAQPVDDDSLEAIRTSLTQTLARFSQLAASTDDPHRAREYLETAKRAAETLRTLPR